MENQEKGKDSAPDEIKNKKIKNLTSLVILLGGLFIGSLFVDVIQLIKGGGYSQRMLSQVDVFTTDDKTWVAFNDPAVEVKVVTDSDCATCDPASTLVSLRRALPTLLSEKVEFDSEEGQEIIEEFNVTSLPAFVFSEDVEGTELFAQAPLIFEQQNDTYLLNSERAGLPVGKYLEIPEVTENDIVIGNRDAKVKIIEFSDFECPFCKQFHENVITEILEDQNEDVAFVYKHLPLSFHAQAENAALASECANEQDMFLDYTNKLFAEQEQWSKTTGNGEFKSMAAEIGLSTGEFNECLDSRRYQDRIQAGLLEAEKFGVSGTPGTFINDNFQSGVVTLEKVEEVIASELAEE